MRIMFKIFFFFSSFGLISLFASETLATVNDWNITKQEVNEFVIKSIPGMNYDSLTKFQKKAVVNQMIERRLYLEDAKKMSIEKNPLYQEALEKLKENLLLDFWMKEKVEEIAISDAAARRYYRASIDKFTQPASVKVRHILVTTEKEAIMIISELNHSKNIHKKFIELAKSESTGPSSKNGGELDWFVYDQMVPEFSEAAFSLKKGEITTQPVKTQFGYHVIYLEDKKEKSLIPYEKVKPKIVKALRLARFKIKLENLSKKLKKTADISVK